MAAIKQSPQTGVTPGNLTSALVAGNGDSSDEIDLSTNKPLRLEIRFSVTCSTAPAVGDMLADCYLLPSIDGEYPSVTDGASPAYPMNCYVGSFEAILAVTTEQVNVLVVEGKHVPASGLFKVALVNRDGENFTASDIRVIPSTYE